MKDEKRIQLAINRMMSDGFEGWFLPALPTEQLSAFSESIGASQVIQSVPVEPFDRMLHGRCFDNCLHTVDVMGGELVHGWAWHQVHDFFVVAEFHGVWCAPDGQLIDLTPPAFHRSATTFSRDPVRVQADAVPGAIFKGSEPSRRFALKDIEDVHEWICAENANAAMNRRKLEAGENVPLAEVAATLERNVNARARLVTRLRRMNAPRSKN